MSIAGHGGRAHTARSPVRHVIRIASRLALPQFLGQCASMLLPAVRVTQRLHPESRVACPSTRSCCSRRAMSPSTGLPGPRRSAPRRHHSTRSCVACPGRALPLYALLRATPTGCSGALGARGRGGSAKTIVSSRVGLPMGRWRPSAFGPLLPWPAWASELLAPFVRSLHGYYGTVRLPASVRHGRILAVQSGISSVHDSREAVEAGGSCSTAVTSWTGTAAPPITWIRDR